MYFPLNIVKFSFDNLIVHTFHAALTMENTENSNTDNLSIDNLKQRLAEIPSVHKPSVSDAEQ